MKRRSFLAITGGSILIGGEVFYLLSDKNNPVRTNIDQKEIPRLSLYPDEREILFLASLSPSGHNTQPWIIKYIEPYHWVISNDKSRWLDAVDPHQRETILSIGAFLQNLQYAAFNRGYQCDYKILAHNNQDENLVDIKLTRENFLKFDIEKIKKRRTLRSHYLKDVLKKEDVDYLIDNRVDTIQYFPNTSKEYQTINELTISANGIQSYRDDAQNELSKWIRFSSKDAKKYEDGLSLAGMEIEGIQGWYLRNFYSKKNVMTTSFRDQGIDKVVKQVAASGGWFLITSKDNMVGTLIETGMEAQRLFLKVREKNIAIHPMSQIIEEAGTHRSLTNVLGIKEPVQFILRIGYVADYPAPVTLRRSIDKFMVFVA